MSEVSIDIRLLRSLTKALKRVCLDTGINLYQDELMAFLDTETILREAQTGREE